MFSNVLFELVVEAGWGVLLLLLLLGHFVRATE